MADATNPSPHPLDAPFRIWRENKYPIPFLDTLYYQDFSYFFILVPIFMIVMYNWLPETPTYYLLKHNDEDARKSLNYLRNNRTGEEFNRELENLSAGDTVDISRLLPELWKNRKSLLVMAVCALAMHISRAEVFYYDIMIYLVSFTNDQFSEVILPTSIFATITLGLVTVDWIGRRRLLLFCSICSILNNIVSGLSFCMEWNDTDHLLWIPSLAMVISILCYGVGFNTISFILLGELFPTKIKHVAAFLFVLLSAGIRKFDENFFIVRLGTKYMCILNIFTMIIATVVIFIFLPETKEKSLTEIQLMLNNKPRRNVVV